MNKILLLALAISAFACNQPSKVDLSKSFALPTYEQTAAISASAAPGASVIVSDSTLSDGSRLVTIRLYPPSKPPVDTIPTYPPDTSTVAGIGANTFPWIPLDKLQMFSTLRCYIASGWIWRPGGLYSQPMYQAETAEAHGLDDYFTAAKARNIDILPCINQTPEWYRQEGSGTGSNDFPPIKKGLSRTDPNSYKDYAEFWYQFCARYGSTKHPDSDLRVDQTPRWPGDIKNVKKSGLGLIKYVEINNEVMRWWDKGTEKNEAYMHPEEFAAMMSIVYDACKRADPNIQVIMGGTTNFELGYIKAMNAWFMKNRADKKFASDRINVHHYSSRFNQLGTHPPTWKNSSACLPSEDKDFPSINSVVAYAKTLGLKVWVTEFGADTKPPSWMHVTIPGMSDEEAQGKLIVDTYKAYFAAGVERCYMFMAADEPGNNGGLWQTCGIMRNKENGYSEKQSYSMLKKYIQSLKKTGQ